MKRVLILLAFAVSAFFISYGATALAWPIHDRSPNQGYFDDRFDNSGTTVLPQGCSGEFRYWNGKTWCNSFPDWVGTGPTPAADFVNYIRDRADGGYGNHASTGAQFIIHTIIGSPPWERHRSIQEWQYQRFWDTMITAEAQGRIDWWNDYPFNINSYWQGTGGGGNYNDDAFFAENGSGYAMVISNPSGGTPYVLRWECANPVGRDDVAWVRAWSMDGFSSVTNETSAARGNRPQPGDRIRFTHELVNRGPNHTGQNIWFEVRDQSENILQGGTPSGEYAPNESRVVDNDEVITIPLSTPAGTRYCRKIAYVYSDSNGNSEASALACAEVVANFDLTPHIDIQITDIGGQPVSGTAQPGDTIRFRYWVANSLPGASSGTQCTIYGLTRTGYYAVPNPKDTTSDAGFVQPAHGCPRNFPSGNTVLVTETVPAASVVANRSICRTLLINPATLSGGSRDAEVCAYVATKPYFRAYGGDVSAGGGLVTSPDSFTSCSLNGNAAVVGWNQRLSGAWWAGAGVQFGIYAMNRIFDTSNSIGNTGGGSVAPRPDGLSFANNGTNTTAGNFGGGFGSAACMPDYYSARPATTQSLPPGIDAMTTGTYGANNNVYWSGAANIFPGERMTVYVDGDVYINTNIRYAGTWSVSNMPLFKLVVRGNIFIDLATSQLDGVYIAQPRANGTGGEIHTCAVTFPVLYQPIPLSGNFYSRCSNKLTVNGSLIAKQIRLLRTRETLRSSAVNESATGNMAEAINYNPAMWIPQPSATQGGVKYDAITTLPPIL